MHELRPAVCGVLLEDESIVDEPPIEDKIMGAGDKQGARLWAPGTSKEVSA
jgi:hypothetical protein